MEHDDRRQDNRVAARGIDHEKNHKLWMSSGDVFLRMSTADAKAVMKKDDESIAEEIEVARRELLEVNAELERIAGSGTAHRVGASLQGMNASEVNQILGGLPGRGMGGIAEE